MADQILGSRRLTCNVGGDESTLSLYKFKDSSHKWEM